jgi:hypothetical protein
MALTHAAATRNSIADAVLADIGTSGFLVLYTSGDAEVATLPLSATAGVVTAEDLVFNSITDDSSATGGVVSYMAIETSGAAEVFRFNATGDGVTLSSTTITATDTVTCSALTYTAPA